MSLVKYSLDFVPFSSGTQEATLLGDSEASVKQSPAEGREARGSAGL